MLILGKLKDYYDGVVQTTGIDKTIVYDRRRNIEPIEDFNKLPQDFIELINKISAFQYDPKKTRLHMSDIYVIGFCGKMYVAWDSNDREYFGNSDVESLITYDLSDVVDLVNTHTWLNRGGDIQTAYNNLINYDPIAIHRTYGIPIFTVQINFGRYGSTKKAFIMNPMLKVFKFFRIFDSFQALQEIQMFLSGVLGTNENKIIDVADKYKIESHGFDKHSFRKEKRT